MRVVFMGTPEIAASVLKSLIESRHEVVGVVTQPDRPNARGNEIIYSDVKKVALEYNIPVLQPEKASEETSVESIRALNPDIIVVTAYGQILKENILNLPKYRCINVHASLLPKYRGASPIQWAIINGEKETGVTIMYMEKGLDTGDMILAKSIEIASKETAGTLHDRLAEIAGPTLLEAMELIESGKAVPVKQNDEESTYVKMLSKSMGELKFDTEAVKLERLIRGLIPWPGAFTFIEGRMLKIWECEVSEEQYDGMRVPGRFFTKDNSRMFVETNDKCLELTVIQAEGKKRMNTADYLRGAKLPESGQCGRA